MKRLLLPLFLLSVMLESVYAQDKLSLKDATEMITAAKEKVQSFSTILNEITNSQYSQGDIENVEKNSYTYPRKLIYDNQVTVEDDVNPESGFDKKSTINILKYYEKLYTQYEKTPDDGIEFSNIDASYVKRNKDFLFVLVKYDSQFKNKYLPTSQTYPTKQRVALVRIDYVARNRWEANISNITFYNQREPITTTEHNVQVLTDTSATASTVTLEQIGRRLDSLDQHRAEENRNNNLLSKRDEDKGDSAMSEKRYKDAIDAYQSAQDLKPLDVSVEKKIVKAKTLMFENSYDYLLKEAIRFRSELRSDSAIYYYNKAIEQKPEKSGDIQALKDPLTKQLNIISPPQTKLKAGNFKEAIEESNALLKDHKKEKDKFPELFLILAEAYSMKYERNDDVSGSQKNALNNYNLAIQYFPNYFDARIARANFQVAINPPAYLDAISDFEALIRDLSDKIPDKAVYVSKKAGLEDKMGSKDVAIADYTKAIGLQPKMDSLYFERGELYYRSNNYALAKKDFDVAIRLNPQYNVAYYYRGLNFVASNNIDLAGQDFGQLGKLAIQPDQLKKIELISSNFLFKGDSLYNKHDFANADSSFNNALKIRPCNAKAFHEKARICFTTADELSVSSNSVRSKMDDAKKNYLKSIELNRKAVHCDTSYSDAYFKEGLAQVRLKQYDQAIQSYSKAMSTNSANIEAILERGNTYEIQQAHQQAQSNYSDAINLLKAELDTTKNKSLVKTLLSYTYQLDGESMYNSQDYKNAKVSLNLAIDVNKYNADAFYYRGLVYKAENDLSNAISDYNDAIAIQHRYNYNYDLGIAYFLKQKYEQAINSFDKAIDLDTFKVKRNTYYLKGLSYFKDKQYDLALTDYDVYEKSADSKNDDGFYADYGMAELYKKQHDLAVKYFNRALALAPNNAKAQYGMGCALSMTGEFDKALIEFGKAFSTHQLHKADIKLDEETFLDKLKDDKNRKKQYNQLKQDNNFE